DEDGQVDGHLGGGGVWVQQEFQTIGHLILSDALNGGDFLEHFGIRSRSRGRTAQDQGEEQDGVGSSRWQQRSSSHLANLVLPIRLVSVHGQDSLDGTTPGCYHPPVGEDLHSQRRGLARRDVLCGTLMDCQRPDAKAGSCWVSSC